DRVGGAELVRDSSFYYHLLNHKNIINMDHLSLLNITIKGSNLTDEKITQDYEETQQAERCPSMTYLEEAEDGRNDLMVMDPERLKIFVDYMEKRPVGLVRSPSLAPLESNPDGYKYKGFNEFWKSKTGSSWMSISNSILPARIIVDEAQVVYGSIYFLEDTVNELSSTQHKHDIWVLLLNTYQPNLQHYIPRYPWIIIPSFDRR
ncbi:402_t:CDS:2, partial [Acaulospora morrowiae]